MADTARAPAGFVEPPEAAEQIASLHRLDIEQAREIVTDGIQLGRIPARYTGGKRASVEELDGKLIWSTGRMSLGFGPSEADGGHVLQVIVPIIEISIAAALGYAAEVMGAASAPKPMEPARDRGGRPTEHDWRAATRQLLLRMRDQGWPATKAELVAELCDWFARRNSEPPDESTVRRFVSAIWPAGRCELEPKR